MELEEFYKQVGGNFEDVKRRLLNEEFIRKFVLKFKDDETFDNLIFPKPTEAVLARFEETISPMFEKMGVCERENEELTKLRDWLLPVLMNGQATVEWKQVNPWDEILRRF